jgi:hypothetical protein
MNFDLNPTEKVKILNYILYQVHGFKGNVDSYHDPSNSFLNQVLETKKGNPILLAVLYILIAQRLNIPIYGVNLPQHFVLAYLEEKGKSNLEMRFNDIEKMLYQDGVKGWGNFPSKKPKKKEILSQFTKLLAFIPKKESPHYLLPIELLYSQGKS